MDKIKLHITNLKLSNSDSTYSINEISRIRYNVNRYT